MNIILEKQYNNFIKSPKTSLTLTQTFPGLHHHHQNQQPQMWRNGVSPSVKRRSQQQYQHQFTTDPSQLKGELLTTRLYKGPSGFGFTLIGNDGGNVTPEYIQVRKNF